MAGAAAAALLLQPRLLSLPSLAPTFTSKPAPFIGRRGAGARLRAVGDGPGAGLAHQTTVYNGVYGPWTVEDSDVREVLLYRSGLVTAAASFVAAASAAFLPEGNIASDATRPATHCRRQFGPAALVRSSSSSSGDESMTSHPFELLWWPNPRAVAPPP